MIFWTLTALCHPWYHWANSSMALLCWAGFLVLAWNCFLSVQLHVSHLLHRKRHRTFSYSTHDFIDLDISVSLSISPPLELFCHLQHSLNCPWRQVHGSPCSTLRAQEQLHLLPTLSYKQSGLPETQMRKSFVEMLHITTAIHSLFLSTVSVL